MATEQPNQKVDIQVNGKDYKIDTEEIPYFKAFVDFQKQSGQALIHHGEIPYLDVVLAGIEKGFHHCFRMMPAEIAAYRALSETIDFLLLPSFKSASTYAITNDVQNAVKKHRRVMSTKQARIDIAEQVAFHLVQRTLMGKFKNPNNEKDLLSTFRLIFKCRGVFKRDVRKIVDATFLERSYFSEGQPAELDKCRVDVNAETESQQDENLTSDDVDTSDTENEIDAEMTDDTEDEDYSDDEDEEDEDDSDEEIEEDVDMEEEELDMKNEEDSDADSWETLWHDV